MKKFISTCLCLLILGGHISAKEPKWFRNSARSGYSLNQFFVGYGVGASYEEATNLAKADIAGQLETTITSEVSIKENESFHGATSSFSREASAEIESLVKQTIQGVQIGRRAKRKGKYYILATLNKKAFSLSLKDEISQAISAANKQVSTAKNFENKKDIQQAIQHYDAAIKSYTVIEKKIGIYNMAAKRKYAPLPNSSAQKLRTQITEILNKISVSVVEGNNQSVKLGQELAPITFQALYDNTPLQGIPITVRYSDRTKVNDGYTNQNGTFTSTVVAIPFQNNQNYIVADIILDSIPAHWNKALINSSAKSVYIIEENDIRKINLVFTDAEINTEISQSLIDQIENMGITLSESAPVTLEATLTEEDIKEIDGIFGDKFIVTSKWVLTLKTVNNLTLGNIESRGKGVHKNKTKAIEKSKKSIKLKKADFLELLSKEPKGDSNEN
jgi:hypothetical protein